MSFGSAVHFQEVIPTVSQQKKKKKVKGKVMPLQALCVPEGG